MIQSTLYDNLLLMMQSTLNDTVYIKWYGLHFSTAWIQRELKCVLLAE